ncbi:hypothetical protein MKX03_032697 [Papaver bracteatum]|nr:hypothetical protein MKX03_032697 [Papaver bracteatum]
MLLVKQRLMVVVALVLSVQPLSSLSQEVVQIDGGFVYNGFKDAASNLRFGNGIADITPNGQLRLTNNFSGSHEIGHAFYSRPLRLKNIKQNSPTTVSSLNGKNNSPNGTVFSFSTSFIFSIVQEDPQAPDSGSAGEGIAFVLAPQAELPGVNENGYLGLFNSSTVGHSTNHVIAVELDTVYTKEYDTIKGQHIGIDINNLRSEKSEPPKYYTDSNGTYRNLSLTSGDLIQVWIEYDGVGKKLNVTLAPITEPKPEIPLLFYRKDLSAIILDSMYAGFSASTSSALTSHYIWGWSFRINGTAPPIDLSPLSESPQRKTNDRKQNIFGVELPIIIPILVLTFILGIIFVLGVFRCNKSTDGVEDLEQSYGRLRFSYRELYIATKGFRKKQLLGIGGFGMVYKGELGASKTKIAVKRISHNSKQGVREFISEIISIGHLRHRNLVQLLAYCRRNKELLLVYDYMPNGSLVFGVDNLNEIWSPDFSQVNILEVLSWNQRFQIIKGVASGLIYLHEEWEQVVIHRDIKASNVLLDGEMNARLGDFGLARLYNRGTNPQTTNVVGTLGYMAPEMTKTGRATTSSDVFAFGAFLLEVACGRRPVELHKSETEGEVLVDWVLCCWRRGAILQTSDPNLVNEYVKEEMEMVLKLGLLCSHNDPKARPSMRQVLQYLEGDMPLPETELWALYHDVSTMTTITVEGGSYSPDSVSVSISNASSVAESFLSGPR